MRQARGPDPDATADTAERGSDPRQEHRPLDETPAIKIRCEPMAVLQRAARKADDGPLLVVCATQRSGRERHQRPKQDNPNPARIPVPRIQSI